MHASIGNHSAKKGVLVTGCSSGIGRATALCLAKYGYTVFATVRREIDAEQLRELNEPNLVPVCPLDLTSLEQVTGAFQTVERALAARGINGLYAIVNNAGGGSLSPIELMDVSKFTIELEARLVGPVALLQAFLPLVRQAHGRIVWIVTPAIMPIPYVSMIHACDFAANCIARTLNLELKPWGIPSIMVRCGGIDTASPAKTEKEFDEALMQWPQDRLSLYLEQLMKEKKFHAKFDAKRTSAQIVGETVCRALRSARPRARYQVGYLSGLSAFLECLPQQLMDKFL